MLSCAHLIQQTNRKTFFVVTDFNMEVLPGNHYQMFSNEGNGCPSDSGNGRPSGDR